MWMIMMAALAADGESLKHAADLPVLAHELRGQGVPDGDVGKAIAAAKGKGLKAEEAADVLEEADKDVKEHGPVDNFGAFVQSKLDEGLRGKELAAAIKAEHVAKGKGKGHGKHGKDGEHGKAGAHGKSGEAHGKPSDKGPGAKGPGSNKGAEAGGKGKGSSREAAPAGKGKGAARPTPAPAGKGKGAARPTQPAGKGKGSSR